MDNRRRIQKTDPMTVCRIGCAFIIASSMLVGGSSADARPKQSASHLASQVLDYTDEAGTTHLTNVPNSTAPANYRVLVEAEPMLRSDAKFVGALTPPPAIEGWISEAAAAERVEPALIYAVMAAESGFNPRALSIKGAAGLMQLMPDTASRYGVSDRFDARTSIFAGTRYLRDLLDQFKGDKMLALAAYNAGEAAVVRYHSEIPPFAETQSYVPRVMTLYRTRSHHADDEP